MHKKLFLKMTYKIYQKLYIVHKNNYNFSCKNRNKTTSNANHVIY